MKFVFFAAAVSAVRIQREPLLTWAPTPPKASHPTDYFVPHFGEDADMLGSRGSIAAAEKQLGHFWTIPPTPDGPPMDYFSHISVQIKTSKMLTLPHRKHSMVPG